MEIELLKKLIPIENYQDRCRILKKHLTQEVDQKPSRLFKSKSLKKSEMSRSIDVEVGFVDSGLDILLLLFLFK